MSEFQPPPPPARRDLADARELADTIPGAVPHDIYAGQPTPREAAGAPSFAPPPESPPSAWNLPAFGLLALFLLALAALLWPQWRARSTEHKIKPLVVGLSGRADAGARCPRYITAIFTNVGSVSLDANGQPSDHTNLTGPICDAMQHFYRPGGRRELDCLLTDGRCPESARQTIVAMSTIAHESMHLAGVLDEAQAECSSIAAGERTAQLTGLRPEQGRMIAYLHLTALNPNTPEQYSITRDNCPGAAELLRRPPGTEAARSLLTTTVEDTWITLGDDD